MWNEPSARRLARLPKLHATAHKPWKEIVIREHFFIGGRDWYVAEYDAGERIFFGYMIQNHDMRNAEWGYFSFDELRDLRTPQGFEVDWDLHWHARKASEIYRVRRSHMASGRF